MYQYTAFDQQFVDRRVAQFRDQTARYLAGDLSDGEFLPLRLRNGLYVQRMAPMLRVAIPYGVLGSHQLRMLARIARDYDKGYGHFTTRQNIQFNWPALEEVPDILAHLASVQMHAIQTSGNCIRNVTTDPLAGVAADESVDPRPWCELIRQWSTDHPEFAWLPRKFKIAVNGAAHDRAAIAVHDIGIRIGRNAAGEVRFTVLAGGGLGRTPAIGVVVGEDLAPAHLLTFLEAILRTYNRFGRRDNKYKARIKILVRAMGADAFREAVHAEWEHLRDGPETLDARAIEPIAAHFAPRALPERPARSLAMESRRLESRDFGRWLEHNVQPHRQAGYANVVLSLKRTGVAPGDVDHHQMDCIAQWADRYAGGEVRVTHEQNLVLVDVALDDLPELWSRLQREHLATPNIGTINDMICCPGGDFCSLANAKSLPVAEAIAARIDADPDLADLGEIHLNISGCMNACGHHHVGNIGILGVDKKGAEFYQVSIGGDATARAALAEIIGPSFSRAEVTDAVVGLLEVYRRLRQGPRETFADCFRRVGIEPFREHAYADAD